MKRFFSFFIAAVLGLTALATGTPAGAGPTAEAGAYRVSVTTDPAVVPAQGKVTLKIRITDRSGKPASGVSVRALTKMPGMDMGEREAAAVPAGDAPGEYMAPATFAMEGGYESTLTISGPLGSATARLPLRTGENTRQAPRAAFSVPLLLGVVAGALLVAFVLWRLRRMGRLPHARQIINRQTVGGLLLLAVATAASVYAVKNLRRPGALTPVDAQAMDMSYMPPPPGFAPVELATVSRGSVESWVRYAATAVGFAEETVAQIIGTTSSSPSAGPDPVLRALLQRAEQERPEVQSFRLRVESARRGESAAHAGFGPQVNVFVMGDVAKATGSRASGGTTYGLAASLPLWEGGARRARSDEAQATREAEEAQQEQSALKIAQEVNEAYLRAATAEQNVATAEAALASATGASAAAEARYQAGRSVLTEVLDAAALRTRAQSDVFQARLERSISQDRLRWAVGML